MNDPYATSKKVIDGIKPFISKSINLLIIIPESFGMISGL